MVLWFLLLPVGYALARGVDSEHTFDILLATSSLPRLGLLALEEACSESSRRCRSLEAIARDWSLASRRSRRRGARGGRGAGRAGLRGDQGPRRASRRGDEGVARGRASQRRALGCRGDRARRLAPRPDAGDGAGARRSCRRPTRHSGPGSCRRRRRPRSRSRRAPIRTPRPSCLEAAGVDKREGSPGPMPAGARRRRGRRPGLGAAAARRSGARTSGPIPTARTASSARLAPDAGPRFSSAWKAHIDRIFADARRAGRREPRAAYAADALVALASEGPCKPVEVRVTVDSAALARGHTKPGERCEINGVGPVPVTTARALLDDAARRVLISATATTSPPCRHRSARSRPSCAGRSRPATRRARCSACANDQFLEIDHIVPLEDTVEPKSTTCGGCARTTIG